MTTGNTQTMGGQPRIRRSLALLCVAALLLGLWMPWAKAADIVVIDKGGGVYQTADGITTVFPVTVSTPNWTITEVTAGGNNYHLSGAFFAPEGSADVALTYNGSDTITADRISIADATVTAGGAANTFTATLTGITADTTLAITVRAPTIKLTFSVSDVYTVHRGMDAESTEYSNTSGEDFVFELRPNMDKYQFVDATAVTGCTISSGGSTSLTGTELGLSMELGGMAIKGTIPGINLKADSSITFETNLAKLKTSIGVIEVIKPGFRLHATEPAFPPAGQLQARLEVEAAYSNSTPVLTTTVPDCTISETRKVSNPDTGDVTYDYACVIVDGSFDADLAVTVTGIELNNPPPVDPTPPPVDPTPPPSGGGDSGGGGGGEDNAPAAPTIRVENELNKGDIKSDTTLWPGHTTERDGVSTTTVTDAELKALLELARQHAKDIEGIPGEGLKEGIFYIEDLHTTSENATYVLELTGDQLQTLEQEGWDRLTVQTPAGSFSLYPEALAQAGAEITDGSQPVRITLHRLDYENRPGVDANLTVDKKQVTSFETPYGVRIVVPYTPAPGEDVNALIIDYIHEDGTVERVTECHYDPEAGGLVFFTTHLSKFGVAYRPAAFVDVTAKHWANPYVTFLASRGVISGYGDKKFRPDDLATRGETIAMLTKALSAVKCPKKPIQVYTDVALGSSISGASNWLYFNNLAPFLTTGTRLKPGASVAKQDVAALVNNVAAGVGLRVRSRGLDTGYTDLGELADYAKPAVIRLTAAGVLTMTSNFKFNPKTNLNRGELAQITAALLSNL